jgi:hypothetical protein
VANSRKGIGKGGSSKIWRYLTVEESYLVVEMSGETCAVWSAMPEKDKSLHNSEKIMASPTLIFIVG